MEFKLDILAGIFISCVFARNIILGIAIFAEAFFTIAWHNKPRYPVT
ncbi:hypothetical protein PQG46_11905 [Aquirufa nivalisilvae]